MEQPHVHLNTSSTETSYKFCASLLSENQKLQYFVLTSFLVRMKSGYGSQGANMVAVQSVVIHNRKWLARAHTERDARRRTGPRVPRQWHSGSLNTTPFQQSRVALDSLGETVHTAFRQFCWPPKAAARTGPSSLRQRSHSTSCVTQEDDAGWAKGQRHLDEPNNAPSLRKFYFRVSRQAQKWHLCCRGSREPEEGQSEVPWSVPGQMKGFQRAVIYVGPGTGRTVTDGRGTRKGREHLGPA